MKKLLRASVNALPLRARHWIKHIPALAASQRWVVNRVLSREPFVHTINAGPARGLHFEITLPADKAIWSGTFESEFADALRKGVRRGDVCYDIGGYRGYMSGVLALSGAKEVIMCEPLPKNIEGLQRLIELNPKLALRLQPAAIGRTDGSTTFKVMPDRSMGKLGHSSFQAEVSFAEEITVEIARLDSLVFKLGLPRPNLLKIDVEGAERDVLEGAGRILRECRPVIFLEAHSESLAGECIQSVASLGYNVQQLEQRLLDASQARHVVLRPA